MLFSVQGVPTMSSMVDVREVVFQVITDDFDEREEGIVVTSDAFPVPFLFNFLNLSKFTFTIANQHNLGELTDAINQEVEPYGSVMGAVATITGYPMFTVPDELDQPLIIEYGGRYFRLYNHITPSTGSALPCYVPYSAEMKLADRWVDNSRRWPLRVVEKNPLYKNLSYSSRTLH